MKIISLDLLAFGPFSSDKIPFGSDDRLHVLFGANEAGKSSALRALHALLFGIPGQTPDAFVHPYDSLRVGGRFQVTSGDEVAFVRRKGNKNTVLNLDGTVGDDRIVDRLLGGITAEQFSLFWGIDLPGLVRGGQDLLAGRGDLGEALFEAGTGAIQLRRLREAIEEEAAALFAPRAHNRAINKAVARLKQLRSDERNLVLSVDYWTAQEATQIAADAEIQRLSTRLREIASDRVRLQRLQRVMPLIRDRNARQRELESMGAVMFLSDDFSDRRREAFRTLGEARTRLEVAEERLAAHEAALLDLGTTPPLAGESVAVGELHKRLGSYRKALHDRPILVARQRDELDRATKRLKRARPDLDAAPDNLRVFVDRRARIQSLASDRERLDERLATTHRAHEAAIERAAVLAQEAAELPRVADASELRRVIKSAAKRSDAASERKRLLREIDRASALCNGLAEKLGIPAEAVSSADHLVVPALPTIKNFAKRLEMLSEDDRASRTERQRIAKSLRETNAKIERLHQKQAVPTEEDLSESRAERDVALDLLRTRFEKGRDVTAEIRSRLGPGKPFDRLGDRVQQADNIADRLRFEADRVAELSQLIQTRGDADSELARIDAEERHRDTVRLSLNAEWAKQWTGVVDPPPSIDGAVDWHGDFERLLSKWETLTDLRAQLTDLEGAMRTLVGELREVIEHLGQSVPAGEDLLALLRLAEDLQDRFDAADTARQLHAARAEDSEAALQSTGRDLKSAEIDLQRWAEKWSGAVAGLTEELLPSTADVLEAVDALADCFASTDKASDLDGRIVGIDRDADVFRAEVQALVALLGDTLGDVDEATWLERTSARLGGVLRDEERRSQARLRLHELRADADHENAAIDAANVTLAALRRESRCASDEELPALEERSEIARTLQSELLALDREILRNGDGVPLAALEAEADDADGDPIPVLLQEIDRDIQDVERELNVNRDARANASAELRHLGGPSQAADKSEEIAGLVAHVRGDAIRYARLRAAATILARRIEEFRRENQAPLLRRAGELFAELTCGSFTRLEADMDDDTPLILGCRLTGERVRVEGMSAGTRDQLFLALRLAAVEASCTSGEPLPFIADDVLMQFDDERTSAALGVLASMTATTQVILFTHHGRVRDLAERLGPRVAIHVMASGERAVSAGEITLPAALLPSV